MKYLKHFILTFMLFVVSYAQSRVIVVEAGNAESLLQAIEQANQQNAAPGAKRIYVLVPGGYYDLGETVLTNISGYNISLVGQGVEQTVIRNAPPTEKEGIGTTATILNLGTGTYLQDLTLRNDLSYYETEAAGRAVCLQDKGTHTICKRVRMLSYQDTYYSWSEDAQHFMDDTEIHGTVDFICGASDVYFRHCTIVTEPRNLDGKGLDVIVAPRTSETPWGFVFDGCTIRCVESDFHYARGWHTAPHCVWLNTTLLSPEKLQEPRFDPLGMRTVNSYFKEYNTMDSEGRNITPASNVVTFVCKGEMNTIETVMKPEEAAKYSPKTVFPSWRPDKLVRKLEKQSLELVGKYL